MDYHDNQLRSLPELPALNQYYHQIGNKLNLYIRFNDMTNQLHVGKDYYHIFNSDPIIISDLDNSINSEPISKLNCANNLLVTLPELGECEILNCSNNQLTKLPDLTRCQILACAKNQLVDLPQLDECKILYCHNNHLTTLTGLNKCYIINCSDNQLIKIEPLSQCMELNCSNNRLIYLPDLPKYHEQSIAHRSFNLRRFKIIDCNNNPLSLSTLSEYRKFWHFKCFYLSLKFLRLWYKGMLNIKSKKKEEIHIELQYSPKLPFYRNHDWYQHFHDLQNFKS